jgi:RNA polymerase sigma-70 factor (ECF subfamily)
MEYSNQQLIRAINQGDVSAFKELYRKYYVFLCLIAGHIVTDHADAEEIVSDVFVRLWNIREKIEINTSVKAYLVKAVHNTSLNYLEKSRRKNELTDSLHNSDYNLLVWDSDYPLGRLYEKEILEILDHGISTLPEACREIFLLSRDDEMKYSDIADKLRVSVNTVKTQMKIALAHLREHLKNYLVILLILMVI